MQPHDEQLLDQLYQEFKATEHLVDPELSFKGKMRYYAQKYARAFQQINCWESEVDTKRNR